MPLISPLMPVPQLKGDSPLEIGIYSSVTIPLQVRWSPITSHYMFPCCCKEKFMIHVYGVVCYTEVQHGH